MESWKKEKLMKLETNRTGWSNRQLGNGVQLLASLPSVTWPASLCLSRFILPSFSFTHSRPGKRKPGWLRYFWLHAWFLNQLSQYLPPCKTNLNRALWLLGSVPLTSTSTSSTSTPASISTSTSILIFVSYLFGARNLLRIKGARKCLT